MSPSTGFSPGLRQGRAVGQVGGACDHIKTFGMIHRRKTSVEGIGGHSAEGLGENTV